MLNVATFIRDVPGNDQPYLGAAAAARNNSLAASFSVQTGNDAMSILRWAFIMLVVSLVAALFGFTELSAASADVSRVLFYVFGAIFLVLLILGLTAFRRA
jgi:uncharacterized membrane protein YtjA (UPF0391 family)